MGTASYTNTLTKAVRKQLCQYGVRTEFSFIASFVTFVRPISVVSWPPIRPLASRLRALDSDSRNPASYMTAATVRPGSGLSDCAASHN